MIAAAHEARAAQHTLERVLNEILGVRRRPAQSIRRPVQTAHVVRQRLGIKPPGVWALHPRKYFIAPGNKSAPIRVYRSDGYLRTV